MSVESDTMHYYAELDREERRERAIEREAESQAREIEGGVYDWITERFGENVAIALTDPDGYTDAEVLETVRDARADYRKWLDDAAEKAAIAHLED